MQPTDSWLCTNSDARICARISDRDSTIARTCELPTRVRRDILTPAHDLSFIRESLPARAFRIAIGGYPRNKRRVFRERLDTSGRSCRRLGVCARPVQRFPRIAHGSYAHR